MPLLQTCTCGQVRGLRLASKAAKNWKTLDGVMPWNQFDTTPSPVSTKQKAFNPTGFATTAIVCTPSSKKQNLDTPQHDTSINRYSYPYDYA